MKKTYVAGSLMLVMAERRSESSGGHRYRNAVFVHAGRPAERG